MQEKNVRLVPPKTKPTGNPAPLVNAAVDIRPVITVDVIRPVSTIPVIILNRFMFWKIAQGHQFHQEKMSQFWTICLFDMIVVLAVPQGLNLDKFQTNFRKSSG